MTNQSRSNPTKLSDIIDAYPSEQRLCILDNWSQALATGKIRGLPITGGELEITFTTTQGKTATRTITDHLLLPSEEQQAWFDEQARRSREQIAYGTGNFTVTAEEFTKDPELCETLMKLQQKYLHEKLQTSRPKPSPARPASQNSSKPKTSPVANVQPTTSDRKTSQRNAASQTTPPPETPATSPAEADETATENPAELTEA